MDINNFNELLVNEEIIEFITYITGNIYKQNQIMSRTRINSGFQILKEKNRDAVKHWDYLNDFEKLKANEFHDNLFDNIKIVIDNHLKEQNRLDT